MKKIHSCIIYFLFFVIDCTACFAGSFIDGVWDYSGSGSLAGIPFSVRGICALATEIHSNGDVYIVNYSSKFTTYDMTGKEISTNTEAYNKQQLNGGILVRNNEWHLVKNNMQSDGYFTSNSTATVRKHGYASGYLLDMSYAMIKRSSGGGSGGGGGGCNAHGNLWVALFGILPLFLYIKK